MPWWAGPPPEGDPGTLDLPWYGIGPVAAVRRAYAKAFRYDGRASRGEYWWFALFEVLVMIALYVAVIIPLALTTGPGPVQDGPSEGLMVGCGSTAATSTGRSRRPTGSPRLRTDTRRRPAGRTSEREV